MILTLIVLSLATWRVSALFTRETGPFHIFEKLREKAGIIHDEDGKVSIIPPKFFAELLSCVWCASIWVGAFWAILWMAFPQIALYLGVPFALSTIAIFLDRAT